MTLPKTCNCPECGGHVDVYTYDSGWRRAECNWCEYIAEPAGNKLQAIRNHNERAGPLVLSKLNRRSA